MTKTKYIGFAYPTSDIAREAGYPDTGCWFLKVFTDHKYNVEIEFCGSEKNHVLAVARSLEPEISEWASFSMHEDKYK